MKKNTDIKPDEKPDKDTLKAWHDNPRNWKLGVFYFNKKDKRIFPPKRTYLGWTVNFANPFSILALVVILLLVILMINYFFPNH
jgi:uncharacterized membrane protein